jgi:hypothetical protein
MSARHEQDRQDQDLRERLAAIDPVTSAVSTEPFSSLRAQTLLESAMTSTTTRTDRRSRRPLLAAAAVLAIGAAAGGVVLTQGDDEGADTLAAPKISVSLSLPGGGATSMSCMMFDVANLKGMSPAFAGTATEVDGGTVTLDVDRWYAGGSADQVVLKQPDAGTSAALDGTEFVKGTRYLVTAAQGTVNGCGYTGPATPELEKAFAEAFPAS